MTEEARSAIRPKCPHDRAIPLATSKENDKMTFVIHHVTNSEIETDGERHFDDVQILSVREYTDTAAMVEAFQ